MSQIMAKGAYDFFLSLLKEVDTNYLEIGVFSGQGLAALGTAHPNKQFIGVDPFIEDGYTSSTSAVKVGGQLVSQKDMAHSCTADLKNVILVEQSSIDFYKELTQERVDKLNIGVVFIDGNHHYDYVKNDYMLALELIKNKAGYICFDDVAPNVEGVIKAHDEFLLENKDRILWSKYADLSTVVYSLKEI